MGSCDDDIVDFRLVSSYVPFVLLVIRAQLLIAAYGTSAYFLASWHVHESFLVACLSVIVYFDAYIFRNERLNTASGYVAPVALALTLCAREQPGVRKREWQTVWQTVYWGVQLTWAVSVSFYLAGLALRLKRMPGVHAFATLWACMAVLHILSTAEHTSMLAMSARSLLYYITTSVSYYSRYVLTDIDRNTHSFAVMHLCLHTLFIHPLIMVVSALLFVAFYFKIFTDKDRSTHAACVPTAPVPIGKPAPRTLSDEMLLKELQAARSLA